MGSDVHMSPPTPDEHRIVRSGIQTALYSRHTDNIYRGGTQTWTRQHLWEDPDGSALVVLKQTHPNYRVTTLDIGKHSKGVALPPSAPMDYLGEPDRDWEGEEKRLRAAYSHALRRMTDATRDVGEKEQALDNFLAEKEQGGG